MLSLDANVIVVFIIVWVLVFALSKLFFNRVRRVRDEREKGISANKRAYEQAVESYQNSLWEIEKSIKQAKAAAETAREALAAEAVQEKNRMISEISAECQDRVERARTDLDRVVEDLKAKLEREASGLAEGIEKKLLN
jgi:F0F1-type ATP synthase membrane subunit b/b'